MWDSDNPAAEKSALFFSLATYNRFKATGLTAGDSNRDRTWLAVTTTGAYRGPNSENCSGSMLKLMQASISEREWTTLTDCW